MIPTFVDIRAIVEPPLAHARSYNKSRNQIAVGMSSLPPVASAKGGQIHLSAVGVSGVDADTLLPSRLERGCRSHVAKDFGLTVEEFPMRRSG